MGVGWIDNIYNNTHSKWYIQSVNLRNNGHLFGETTFYLDDERMHEMTPGRYHARSCGIPSYNHGRHYKVLTKEPRIRIPLGIRFYTLEIGADNWIIYEDVRTGRQIARQKAPNGSDFHCNLLIEDQGPSLDILNNPQFSGENAVFQIYNESDRWVEVAQREMVQTLAKSAA